MPWTASDADRHNKGLSSKQKEQWAAVANDVLKRTGDEGRAIASANAAVRESVQALSNFAVRQDISEEWPVRVAEAASAEEVDLEEARLVEWSEALAEPIREAPSDDSHFYGAWRRGGSVSGGAMAKARARARTAQQRRAAARAKEAEAVAPEKRWKDHDAIVAEMEKKYPGSDWGDIRKVPDIEVASASADMIDQLSTRFGPSPAFKGVRVEPGPMGVIAEVKRVNPDEKGSAVYLYDHYFVKPGAMEATRLSMASPADSHVSGMTQNKVDFARSIIAHEMGHQYLGMNHYLRLGPDRNAPVRAAMQPYVDNLMANYGKAHISRYARRQGGHEAWAEAFAAAVGAGHDWSAGHGETYVKDLRSLLDTWYPPGTKATPDRAAGTAVTGIGTVMEAAAEWMPPIVVICGFGHANPNPPEPAPTGLTASLASALV